MAEFGSKAFRAALALGAAYFVLSFHYTTESYETVDMFRVWTVHRKILWKPAFSFRWKRMEGSYAR